MTRLAFVRPVCVTVHVQVRSEFLVPRSRETNLTCSGSARLSESASKLAITEQETGSTHEVPSQSGRQRLKIPTLARE